MSAGKQGKACTKCKEVKALDLFHRATAAGDGRASWCKVCACSIKRESKARTYRPADKRKWQLKTRYGLTPEAVLVMSTAQGGLCALCDTPLVKLCVDHCHNTGKVRGLLCHKCNIRLGGWDDLQWRERALKYMGITQ